MKFIEVVIIDGFKFEKMISYGEVAIGGLLVESNKILQTIDYINSNKISRINLNSSHGYFLKNIDFVTEVADVIEDINIVDDDINPKKIESLHHLKKLRLNEYDYPLDFSNFSQLESCGMRWRKNLSNLNACTKLKRLSLSKFPYTEKTADFLMGLEQIESLEFVQSKFANLEFLQNFPNLKTFELWYIIVLENIDGLKYCADSLNRLILDHCKRIENYEVLGQLTELKWLNVTDSRELENLYFLKKLKKLEHFAFVNTNVVNGDISPAIGIKHVGFFNKRHYSHTNEEIKELTTSQSRKSHGFN